jgi:hypothetical protein
VVGRGSARARAVGAVRGRACASAERAGDGGRRARAARRRRVARAHEARSGVGGGSTRQQVAGGRAS